MKNAEQIAFWNGDVGATWVAHNALMEAMLAPLGEQVIDTLTLSADTRALDVGCGCGQPSLSLARRIGPGGAVTGVDISAPMLELAKGLANQESDDSAPIQFLEADAQIYTFESDSFDVVFSRFGVMFFEDPVAAFTNIRGAMSSQARLAFCCWQPRDRNPFMTVPAMAALELLPAPTEVPPRSPGPFAFEEPDYINAILSSSGLTDIAIEPISHPLVFGPGLSVEKIVERLVTIGPIAQMVREAPDNLQQPVREKVIAAISPFYDSVTGLTLDGEFWQVTATHRRTRRTGNT